MQTSLLRRALPKIFVVALMVAAMGLFYAQGDTVDAQSRANAPTPNCPGCPSSWQANTYQSVSNSAVGANADLTIDLDIPAGSYNFYAINFFTNPNATVKAGPGHPSADANAVLGDVVGTLNAGINISALGQQCNTQLNIPFQLMNATVDNSAGNVVWPSPLTKTGGFLGTLDPLSRDAPAQGGNGGLGMAAEGAPGDSAASINNDLPTGVDRYPGYLNTLFNGIQPYARYLGINIVSNFVNLNFLIFSPGQLAAIPAPNPSNDMGLTSLGYSSITVLNDATAVASPGVTDFCSPLVTTATVYGITKDNPCTDLPAAESDPDTCGGTNEQDLWNFVPGGNTGRIRYANPGAVGTYLYPTFHLSPRDLDGDGYENGFDTCVYTSTPTFDGRAGPPNGFGGVNDTDADFIPGGGPGGGCDVNLSSSTLNEDGDNDGGSPAKEWLNSQDNCPLIANNDQANNEVLGGLGDNIVRPRGGDENDSIGDVCDTAETACANAVDDDGDGLVNDGCPAVGPAEVGCLNSADDDGDGSVNDGCRSSRDVANGRYQATFTLSPICIGGTDNDGDGWCTEATAFPYGSGTVNLSDPNDGNKDISPEHYALTFPFPIAESGASSDTQAAPAQQPVQVCNDGVNQDGDANTDINDADCKPPNSGLSTTDTDGDGASDEAEIWVGTDPLGRCEVGNSPSTSTDWPADVSNGGGAFSGDKVNISDLSAYVGVPRIFNTSPGDAGYNQRFDVVPGTGAVPGKYINISDLQYIALGTAPMFGGAKMYGNAKCSAHPTYND